MNKLYRLPLRTRTKNLSSGVRRRKNSSKILATVILALCALAALVAIGFVGFWTYKHMKGKPKVVSTASPVPSPSPAATSEAKPKDVLLPLSDPNKTSAEGSASAQAAVKPQSSPQVLLSSPVPTPTPTPAASVAQHSQKTESQVGETDKPLSKAARKSLEKKRLEAERKRAQLEKMYQNHEISIDAYNKGKEEYKTEIQKYRDGLKSGK
jgi:cytoskeletal protein RodZ